MRIYTASLRTVVRRLGARHNGERGSPLANARIDAFCDEGCNAAHIRTVSFSQWDSLIILLIFIPIIILIFIILLIFIAISTMEKWVPAWSCCFMECPKGCSVLRCRSLSSFDENNFGNPRWPSSMNP